MTEPAIRISGLGKRYRLGGRIPRRSLRDSVTSLVKNVGRKRLPAETFWALKDIEFEVPRGDIVGIIGRNGAGKSTLLKILSRIVPLTEGRIEIRGRVGSLLEVGTGFHSELSGRENIFLNGAILGMSRHEIRAKFDQIVAFAEVEKFLDTPVKHYSSGMYVRLAFSVAAHLEPEILIVDEVLAVGDAKFQRKCLGKMEDVGRSGRTVLFVSHQMETVQRLCKRAAVLDGGRLTFAGGVSEAIEFYLVDESERVTLPDRGPDSSLAMRLREVSVLGPDGSPAPRIEAGADASVAIKYDINRAISGVHVVCHITDPQGHIIVSTGDCDAEGDLERERLPGRYESRFALPSDLLNEGSYGLTIALGVPFGNVYDRVADAARFAVVDTGASGRPAYLQRRPGVIVQTMNWDVVRFADVEANGGAQNGK